MNLFSTAEANKLINIETSLEKSIKSVVLDLKRSGSGIYEYSVELDRQRQLEWKVLLIKITDIIGPLKNTIKLMKDKKWEDITDFVQFKKEMIIVQENIQNLMSETKIKTESLEKDRVNVTHDVGFYKEMMMQWEEPVKISIYKMGLSKSKSVKTRHQCQEVKEFMDFIHTTGGHENGWSREDHLLFIKFYNKYKNIDTVATRLHQELPDINIEDIKRHAEWYKQYLNLEMKKKNALKLWQENRVINNSTLRNTHVLPKIVNVLEPEENIQEKLIKWKAEREERIKNTKEIKAYQEQKRKELEQLKKKRQEEVKRIVQEWRHSKQALEQQEVAEKRAFEEHEKKRRAVEANKLIKQFQSQDDMYILKIKRQRRSEKMLQVRSKSSQTVKRNPERLLKPTKQWINRIHDENYYSPNFVTVMDLKCLPKLRIPEWRKKLN